MLERALYYTPKYSSPKLNLGEKKSQRNQNKRRGVREYKIEQLREQKEPGASVKTFVTGVNFQCHDLLHFKTNSCFQLYTSQQPTPSSP